MMDVALSLLALIAGGLTLELFADAWSPLDHHGERGFSLETETGDWVEDFHIGNPS